MSGRVLVAGVGNIFLGDDGFGVEVARRLADEPFPDWVRVKDFGIRGVHLAYELLDGYATTILVDAAPRGGRPGSVYVIEPDLDAGPAATPGAPGGAETPLMDGHGMEPAAVFALLARLGGRPGRVVVVGCEPATVEEGIGLSPPVVAAVATAVGVVRDLIADQAKATEPGSAAVGAVRPQPRDGPNGARASPAGAPVQHDRER